MGFEVGSVGPRMPWEDHRSAGARTRLVHTQLCPVPAVSLLNPSSVPGPRRMAEAPREVPPWSVPGLFLVHELPLKLPWG